MNVFYKFKAHLKTIWSSIEIIGLRITAKEKASSV